MSIISEIQKARSPQDWSVPQHKAAEREKDPIATWAAEQAQIRSNVNYQMQLYQIESTIYSGLNHLRKRSREQLVDRAINQANDLAILTRNQGWIDIVGAAVGGGLGLLGGFFGDSTQKIMDSVGKAFVQFSSFGKTFIDSDKIRMQTEQQLVMGSALPQLDEESRNYFQLLKELKETVMQLAHLEKEASRNMFQG